MADARQYSRMNGPRLPRTSLNTVTTVTPTSSSPHTPTPEARRSLPALPALQASPSSVNSSAATSPASVSTRRSALPVPPSFDSNPRRSSVSSGVYDKLPQPRGSRPLPSIGPASHGRRSSTTVLPTPPASPSGGSLLPPSSDFGPSSNEGYSRAHTVGLTSSIATASSGPGAAFPARTNTPLRSLSPASVASGVTSVSSPLSREPTGPVEAHAVAPPPTVRTSSPWREPTLDRTRAADGHHRATSWSQPALASRSATPVIVAPPSHSPHPETTSPCRAPTPPSKAQTRKAGNDPFQVDPATKSLPPLAPTGERRPLSGLSGISQGFETSGPPVPSRTEDVRLYAARSVICPSEVHGTVLQHFNALSSQSQPLAPTERAPSPRRNTLHSDISPLPDRGNFLSRPVNEAEISRGNPARHSVILPFVPATTEDSAGTSSVGTESAVAEQPVIDTGAHLDEYPEDYHDHLPPPYHVASANAPPSITAPFLSPATVISSSSTTASPTTPVVQQHTSIISHTASIRRMHSVRTAAPDGTVMPPSEVLAVAVSTTQQSATVRQQAATPVSDSGTGTTEDEAEPVFRSPPPHLTVIGSGCCLLAYDYRPGPVPDWDTSVRVILNSKSQEVTIHEHKNTPKWRRDETREYIKMLIELHNEVIEEIDDSYAAFGSRGNEPTGLGVGFHLRPTPSPTSEGPSLLSAAESVVSVASAQEGASEAYNSAPHQSTAPQQSTLPASTYPTQNTAVTTTTRLALIPAPLPSIRTELRSPPRPRAEAPAPLPAPLRDEAMPQGSSSQSINVKAPRPAIVSHRVAKLAFGMDAPRVTPPPWLVDATAYLLAEGLLVIDCHFETPEELRKVLIDAFRSSYGALCKTLSQIEQTIVDAFRNDLRVRNLEVSAPATMSPDFTRLVINYNLVAPPPTPPWPAPQIFQAGAHSFQLIFPPAPGGDSLWTQGRQVNIELDPPHADCGNAASAEFRSYLDLFVLALQKVFLLRETPSPSTLPGQSAQRATPREARQVPSSPSVRTLSSISEAPPAARQGALSPSMPRSPTMSPMPFRQESIPLSRPLQESQFQQPVGSTPAWQQHLRSPVAPPQDVPQAATSHLQEVVQALSLTAQQQQHHYGVPPGALAPSPPVSHPPQHTVPLALRERLPPGPQSSRPDLPLGMMYTPPQVYTPHPHLMSEDKAAVSAGQIDQAGQPTTQQGQQGTIRPQSQIGPRQPTLSIQQAEQHSQQVARLPRPLDPPPEPHKMAQPLPPQTPPAQQPLPSGPQSTRQSRWHPSKTSTSQGSSKAKTQPEQAPVISQKKDRRDSKDNKEGKNAKDGADGKDKDCVIM